MTEETSDPC